MEIKLKLKGAYAGHSIKKSGVVNLNFEFEYSELANIVPMIQLLNNDIKIFCKTEAQSAFTLGTYKLNLVRIDHDGTSYVRFNSIIDDVINLGELYGQELELLLKGYIEIE